MYASPLEPSCSKLVTKSFKYQLQGALLIIPNNNCMNYNNNDFVLVNLLQIVFDECGFSHLIVQGKKTCLRKKTNA